MKIHLTISSLLMLVISTSINLNYSQAQSADSIHLVGKLSITGLPIHDVWGYIDDSTGNEYALLCASTEGLRVIDVTDATAPVLVGSISGGGIQAVDVKTWTHYAYLMAEPSTISGKIIDLTDPSNPMLAGTFPGAHNTYISESGYMYQAAPGLRIYDLNPDPENPVLVFEDPTCLGHDISIVGNLLYDFSDNCGTRIFDITQPDTVQLLGTVPASGIFHHSGWPSEDGNHLFICDELASTSENDITVWDISNLANPTLVDSFADSNSYVHNLYVEGDYAFVSYYRAGFRVFNVSDPTAITLAAEYDTDSSASGPGFGGNFGLYTFWGTDKILASDEENGLYIFRFTSTNTGISRPAGGAQFEMSIFPNPSRGSSTLNYVLRESGVVQIEIYSILGQNVVTYNEGFQGPGQHLLKLSTADWPAGIFVVKVIAGGHQQTGRLVVER